MLKKIFATFMVLSSLALTGCTVPTVALGANKVFEHQLKDVEEKLPAQSYDGIKSSLLFDKVEFSHL